mmetsp:Transcript_4061/g.8212  ORF Transcript_4061/g.8212 Transcript_4061/m.8212 type:complete len:131 (-) Transcript_4061:76-468(-)
MQTTETPQVLKSKRLATVRSSSERPKLFSIVCNAQFSAFGNAVERKGNFDNNISIVSSRRSDFVEAANEGELEQVRTMLKRYRDPIPDIIESRDNRVNITALMVSSACAADPIENGAPAASKDESMGHDE